VPYLSSDAAIVRFRGRTLQGPYEGGFVYARSRDFLSSPGGRERLAKAWAELGGGEFGDTFKDIDNACEAEVGGRGEIEKREKGSQDWKDLVFGEGGIGDWIKPGWRGEYN
jgi:hypothetical protein